METLKNGRAHRPGVLKALLLLVVVLAAPLAAGADAGEFVAVALPEGAELSTRSPLALYLPDAGGLSGLVLVAERVHVQLFEAEPLVIRTPGEGPGFYYAPTVSVASYHLSEVRGALGDGDHAGWMGAYLGEGAAVDVVAGEGASVEPRLAQTVGNSPKPEGAPRAERWTYSQLVSRPHLGVDVAGVVAIHGPAAVKLSGPDVVLRARENTTELETQPAETSTAGAPLARGAHAWALLTWENGSLSFLSRRPVELACSELAAAWDGAAAISGVGGELARVDLEGGRAQLSADGRAGRAVGRLAVLENGDAAETAAAGALRAGARGLSWALPVVGLAVAGLIGVRAARKTPSGEAPEGVSLADYRRRFGAKPGLAEMQFAEALYLVKKDESGAEKWLCCALALDSKWVVLLLPVEEGGGGSALGALIGRPAVAAAFQKACEEEALFAGLVSLRDE